MGGAIFSTIGKILLNLAKALIIGAAIKLITNKDFIHDTVKTVIHTIVEGVSQNGSWRGDGAVRFVEEMTNLVLPAVEKAMEDLDVAQANMKAAVQQLEDADQSASQTASALTSEFKSVYTA